MSIDQAEIEKLFRHRDFCAMSKRYGGNNHEDLRSEIMLILLEMPHDKLNNIIKEGYLVPYAINIMRNQVSPLNNTTYRRKFGNIENLTYDTEKVDKSTQTHSDKDIEAEEDQIWEIIREHIIMAKIKDDSSSQTNTYFYHSRLLLLSQEYKNRAKLSRAIGIPYNSILYSIKEYKEYLNQWLASANL